MKVIISGKNIKVTDSIREYVELKLSKLDKFEDFIQEVNVTLSVEHTKSEGELHLVSALVLLNGEKLNFESSNSDMYAGIDEISDTLDRQVRKYKEKLKPYNKKGNTESIRNQ